MTLRSLRPLASLAAVLALGAPGLTGCGGDSNDSAGGTDSSSDQPAVERTSQACDLLTDEEVGEAMQESSGQEVEVTHEEVSDGDCVWSGFGSVSVTVTKETVEFNQSFVDDNIAGASGEEQVDDVGDAQVYYEPGSAKGTVYTGGQYLAQLIGVYVEKDGDDDLNRTLLRDIAERLSTD